jgi:hypothetical protein
VSGVVSQLVPAGSLAVGDEMAAADGYLFTVAAIVRRTPKTVTVLLRSDFSPMRAIRDGVEKTFRSASMFRVIRP